MGACEDLIQRLRNGGGRKSDRPASLQVLVNETSSGTSFGLASHHSPTHPHYGSLGTPSRSGPASDTPARATTPRRLINHELFPQSANLTPPLSSSPASGRRIRYSDLAASDAAVTFAGFADQGGAASPDYYDGTIHAPAIQPPPSVTSFDGNEVRPQLLFNHEAPVQPLSPPVDRLPALHDNQNDHDESTLEATATTPQILQDSDEEYADDDRWFETAMAEVDLDAIRSKSSCRDAAHSKRLCSRLQIPRHVSSHGRRTSLHRLKHHSPRCWDRCAARRVSATPRAQSHFRNAQALHSRRERATTHLRC